MVRFHYRPIFCYHWNRAWTVKWPGDEPCPWVAGVALAQARDALESPWQECSDA
jgi:hypothetical protein